MMSTRFLPLAAIFYDFAFAFVATTTTRSRLRSSKLFATNDGLVLANVEGLVGELSLGGPVVHHYPTEWIMWFHGRSSSHEAALPPISTGRIGMARSEDGLNWERVEGIGEDGAILSENSDEWWTFDTAHVGLGDVVPFQGDPGDRKYENRGPMAMYTFGGSDSETPLRSLGIDRDGSVPAMDLRIGMALSQGDGRLWSRIEGDYPNAEIVSAGDDEAWDSTYVGWPCVAQVKGKRVLYYQALDRNTKKHAIGMTVAAADVKFDKKSVEEPMFVGSGDSFDEGGVSRRCVRPSSQGYNMWYEALGGTDGKTHSIGLATSKDGKNWTPRDSPVFSPSGEDGAWDSSVVSAPYVVRVDDKTLRMYYAGGTNAEGKAMRLAIGAADSKDEGLTWTRVPSSLTY